MLVVETIAKIRRAYFQDKKPIKQICRELRVSRNTVRRVIRSGATEFSYERSVQPQPKIGPWKDELDRMLAENTRKPKRDRLTRIRIFEELQSLGYEGGYDAVRRYASSWTKTEREASAAAYVPLSFDPGEAYQFDWSHEVVLIDGVTTTVKVAHVRLCYSRMLFVRAYPRETQEMVFDAHDKAFAFFGGACARGIYDSVRCPPSVRGRWTRRRPWTRSSSAGIGLTIAASSRCAVITSSIRQSDPLGRIALLALALHARFRLGEGAGREPGRRRPPAVLCAAAAVQELRRAQRLARGPLHCLGQDAPASRAARAHHLGSLRGGTTDPGSLCRAVRRLPRRAGLGLQNLSRPVRQQPILGRRPGCRPGCRGPRLCRTDRDLAGRQDCRRACPRLRPRQGYLRSATLPPCPRPQAWGSPERGAVQGVGIAGGNAARAAQAQPSAERRPPDGRDPELGPDRRPGRGGCGLRRGAERGRSLVRRRSQHPRPAPGARAAADHRDTGRAASELRADRRLQTLRQPQETGPWKDRRCWT
ncbi:Integrase core domain-containing protein [Wenxinia saemankumensis]|uniref:Integrase core domain-containing protein n=1 Tax=Wenxinia saemankumensis TaxID=1447782 RepID=A0A1M6I4Z7_9RHOB|nr:Integrase core domain-containing protein [Wenxinia saemankumensis]